MNKFRNILDYNSFKILEDWEKATKTKDGNITIDDTENGNISVGNTNDKEKLNRVISRIQDKNIDWFCGGNENLEKEYAKENNSIKQWLESNPNRLKFLEQIEGESGYINIKNIINNPKQIKIIKNIFNLNPDDIGKGEVLLTCLFSDIRMKNREDKEKGDCAVVDKDNNIIYHIEVKSGGSGFQYIDKFNIDPEFKSDIKKNIKSDNGKIRYNYAYSIAKHIVSRFQKDKKDENETLFIFFDNKLTNRVSNNNLKGFWWINVGKLLSTDQETQKIKIANKLFNHVHIGGQNTKSNAQSFSITCTDKGITIHPK